MSTDRGRLYARLRGLQRREREAQNGLDEGSRSLLAQIAAEIDRSSARVRARAERAPRVVTADARQAEPSINPLIVSGSATLDEPGALRPRARGDSRATISYPEDLPVSQRRTEIAAKIRDFPVVVVAGQTGSGKTTQLPKICLELGRGIKGLIGHTQPRRIAARSVANRVAEELGTNVGRGLVGFKVRFTDQTSPDAMVKVMTDGILLAETRGDPLLSAYDTIIVDEAHERSLNIDFLLGYLKQLLLSGKRPDLKLVITSATIDTARFSSHFALPHVRGMERGAPVVEVSGRTYPVEARYRPPLSEEGDLDGSGPGGGPGGTASGRPGSTTWRRTQSGAMGLRRRGPGGLSGSGGGGDSVRGGEARDEIDMDLPREVLRVVDEIAMDTSPDQVSTGGRRDVLVFLPGEREIRETAEALRKHHPHGWEIVPLYARLSAEEQQRVFRVNRSTPRRVILATNVAETSLTVPGIVYVVDPGFARISRYSARQKVQRLPIERISRASAEQRRGRAGRLCPGVCYRLYSEDDFNTRSAFTEPEILRTNLASVILQMMGLFGEREDSRAPGKSHAAGPARGRSLPRRAHGSSRGGLSAAELLNFRGIESFPFLEPPDDRMIRDGYETLLELGAIEALGATGRPVSLSERWEAGEEVFSPRGGLDGSAAIDPNLLSQTIAVDDSAPPSPAPASTPNVSEVAGSGLAKQPHDAHSRHSSVGAHSSLPPSARGHQEPLRSSSGSLRYRLTPLGRNLAKFPIDPRLGRMILAAHELHCLDEVLVIAGVLSIQDPRERPGNDRPEMQQAADALHAKYKDHSSDFLGWLKLWHAYQDAAKEMSSNKLRKWCKDQFLNFLRMREWEDLHQQLHTLTADMGLRHTRRGRVDWDELEDDASLPADAAQGDTAQGGQAGTPRTSEDARRRNLAERRREVEAGPAAPDRGDRPAQRPASGASLPETNTGTFSNRTKDAIHRALLTGLITSIGRKSEVPPTFEYDGPRSTKFAIFPGSGLFKSGQKWVMASELVRTSRLYARTLAAIKPEWVEEAGAHLVKRTYHDPAWDAQRGEVMAHERVTLFGLELVKRRLVEFGPVEPATARGLFIHHALVMGEFITDAEWFEHNRRLVQRVAEMENKARRRGLLVDTARRYAFYDSRVGHDVWSIKTFEQWRRLAERKNPRALFMGVGDLLDVGATLPEADEFPDALTARTVFGESLKLSVEYLFDPASDRDGLTVTLKASQVEPFDPSPLEWLVPGLLREKIAELIRTLPKAQRAVFVPAQQHADSAAGALKFGKGDLLKELADYLSRSGTTVQREQFKPLEIPAHLLVNYRVVSDDDASQVVAEGRDWGAIRRKLAVRVRDTLASLPESRYNRDGVINWEFLAWGDDAPDAKFPESLVVEIGAGSSTTLTTAYPALVDPPRAVGAKGGGGGGGGAPPRTASVRLFDSRPKAARAMHLGLRRLLILQIRDAISSLVEHAPGVDRLSLAYTPIGGKSDLRTELEELIGVRAFDEIAAAGAGVSNATGFGGTGSGGSGSASSTTTSARSTAWTRGPIRTRDDFNAAVEVGWNRLGAASEEVFTTVRDVLTGYGHVAPRVLDHKSLPREWATSIADMREQLAALVYPGFLVHTPWRWLRQYPRYLQAMSIRLEKLATGGGSSGGTTGMLAVIGEGHVRDAKLMQEVLPFWRAWREAQLTKTPSKAPAMGTNAARGQDIGDEPELDEFRWMVEEFRVSVFAQNLQTLVPVSSKRLLAQWEKARATRERLLTATVADTR